VLVPLVHRGDALSILFTRRNEHLRQHAGQISFPGGGVEGIDADVIAAARDAGLVVLPAGDNVVRLLPPLTLSEEEAREGVALMSKAASALEMKVAAQ